MTFHDIAQLGASFVRHPLVVDHFFFLPWFVQVVWGISKCVNVSLLDMWVIVIAIIFVSENVKTKVNTCYSVYYLVWITWCWELQVLSDMGWYEVIIQPPNRWVLVGRNVPSEGLKFQVFWPQNKRVSSPPLNKKKGVAPPKMISFKKHLGKRTVGFHGFAVCIRKIHQKMCCVSPKRS